MAKRPTPVQLKKLAKSETDTARAAHFHRQAEGALALKPLTTKSDQKRTDRNKMIDALPPIKPVIAESNKPSEPHSNDIAVLQKQVDDLKADTVELSGQISDMQKASEEQAVAHTKVLEDSDKTINALNQDVKNRNETIAAGEAKLAGVSEELKAAVEQSELQAAAHETEADQLRATIAERDKLIEALQAVQSADVEASEAKADAVDEEPFD
ncbi:MAG: hypothetical protein NXI17_23725 [Alphaproteobacteria bacterium]|nr:hypothetical protein [Alphaproteobacteria bacterium]